MVEEKVDSVLTVALNAEQSCSWRSRFNDRIETCVAKAKSSAQATVKSTFMSTVAKLTKNDDSEPEPEDYDPPTPKASVGDVLAQIAQISSKLDDIVRLL